MTLWHLRTGWLAFLVLALAPLSGQAAEPSFQCAETQGDTEQLICGDDQLAALDVELARVYGLARDGAGMTDESRAALTDAQFAWLRDRDACDRAADPRDCVETAYVTRIADLRGAYPHARSADDDGISLGPFALKCDDQNPPTSVSFVNTDPSLALLAWPDRHEVLTEGRSGSGARYIAEDKSGETVFWIKGNDAAFQVPGQEAATCSIAKQAG